MKGEKRSSSLEQRVLGFIQEHRLVSDGEKLVVAVSGGADSVCLIHILANLQEELKLKLHIAHLNHQLRGADSDADAEYVASLSRKLGIPATIEKRDVKGYQARERLSLEEAAREVRYRFLAQVARSIGAGQVAAGHTRDDHIETILMHLIRGSGTRGMRGLQPATLWQSGAESLTIIRPLLEVSHEETEEYCRQHQLIPRLDASNLSLSPLRNRVRQQLLPLLKSYNPAVAEALLRTGRIADDDINFLDEQVARLWDKVIRQEGKGLILDKAGFEQLPPALKRYLLRSAVERLLGSAKDIEMRHIEEMMSLATKAAGKRLSLPGGLTFAVEYDRYLLTPDPTALSPLPPLKGEFPLNIPGETLLPGWRVEATIVERGEMSDEDDFTAYLDPAKSGDRLLVRPRRRGDRFQPLGLSQSKKLGEFMIDAKIPQAWRGRIPLVCSEEQILWVVGWRLDERAKVSRDTKQVLLLRFEAD
ncbi:MAG: tRNA lysidine(34) synthetase TilS [Dehalococcoidia bacterium]|nr:MAG: tRNA lysidine(34) synthetase TilS [Dehalococcoidia bacterium]